MTNRTLVKGIKKRLGKANGNWADELQHMLWTYRTTVRTPTKETPFRLVYGMEAVIPIVVTIQTTRTNNPQTRSNTGKFWKNMDLLEEKREEAAIRQANFKALMKRYYNTRVKKSSCKVEDLVLRKNEASRQEPIGKPGPNWKGPYPVIEVRQSGAYVLETLDGTRFLRTWNMRNLCKFQF